MATAGGPKPTADFWRDPAMSWVESRRSCQARTCYRLHTHRGYSIGAVDLGGTRFTGARQGTILLRPGTLVLIPPHAAHACNPQARQWSYQMLHLDPVWVEQLLGAEPLLWGNSAEAGIITDPELYQQFCDLNSLLFGAATVPAKEAALIEFVTTPAAEIRSIPVLDPLARQTMRDLLARLEAADETLSLAELAELSGMNRFALIRSFRAATGMTPIAWQLNRRVIAARAALRAGEPVAELAYRLGFADQAHFTRVFKAHTGTTPAKYRS